MTPDRVVPIAGRPAKAAWPMRIRSRCEPAGATPPKAAHDSCCSSEMQQFAPESKDRAGGSPPRRPPCRALCTPAGTRGIWTLGDAALDALIGADGLEAGRRARDQAGGSQALPTRPLGPPQSYRRHFHTDWRPCAPLRPVRAGARRTPARHGSRRARCRSGSDCAPAPRRRRARRALWSRPRRARPRSRAAHRGRAGKGRPMCCGRSRKGSSSQRAWRWCSARSTRSGSRRHAGWRSRPPARARPACCSRTRARPAAATATRWRIAPAPSAPHPLDAQAPGAPRFLRRARALPRQPRRRAVRRPCCWSGAMPRIVSVWLPAWPIERLGAPEPARGARHCHGLERGGW